MATTAVLGVFVLVLAAAGCGGDDEETTTGSTGATMSTQKSGSVIAIDPASGPPGTEIAWTWSDTDCSDSSDKSATLRIGGLNGKEVASVGTKQFSGTSEELSGTLTVPTDAAPGSYTFVIDCFSVGGGVSGGEIGVSFEFEDNADVGFEVTTE